MPIGSFSLLYHLADHLQKHRPKSVLDLGVGFGLSGAIVRQYLDHGVKSKKIVSDLVEPWMDWETKLVGVEGFEGYRNPAWDLYHVLHVNDILDYVRGTLAGNDDPNNTLDYHPDFIILTDVLEHFSKQDGEKLIRDLMFLLAPKGVLMIGTPGIFVAQDAVHGNEYEIHRSLWKWNEFPSGFEVIKNGEPDEFGHRMILVKFVKK